MYIVQQAKYSGLIFSVVTVHCSMYNVQSAKCGWPGNLSAMKSGIFSVVTVQYVQYKRRNVQHTMYNVQSVSVVGLVISVPASFLLSHLIDERAERTA